MNNLWKIKDFVSEVWRGKSNGRIFSNWMIKEHCKNLRGVMVDLGGGDRPSYERYWRIIPEKFVRVDNDPAKEPDVVADINAPLPFPDAFADNIFLFSVLYIIKNPENLFREVQRILKPGGSLWIVSPFLFAEAKEPSDFRRYTSEGLKTLLVSSGFSEFRIVPIGERWSVVASLLSPLFPIRICRIFLFLTGWLLDACVPKHLRAQHPAPLGYFCAAQKIK